MVRISAETLTRFTVEVLERCQVPAADARLAADVLLASDRRGINSHGIARLENYVMMMRAGRINPVATCRVVRETPSTAAIDGGNGLGLVVGPRANELAMKKAEAVGSGWVTVRNSNHFGIAGYYPLQALQRDLIGFAFTNSIALVSPARGSGRVLGTNPIAVAFPGQEEPPVVIDLATSLVPYGKIEVMQRLGRPLGEGWATDRDGRPTLEPGDVMAGGALSPLGGTEEGAVHKGYCLSAMVDLLSGVLSGANWGPFCPPFRIDQPIPGRTVGAGLGHCFGALQIAGFADPGEFKRNIDEWCRTMRAVKPVDSAEPVLIPGDPERAAEAERRVHGIPLPPAVIADLEKVASLTGIPFPA